MIGIKEINVLSWGGGTQSTALMIKMLKGEVVDAQTGGAVKPDYIIFADTKDENEMVYSQIYRVIKWVKETYGKEVIITNKNKELLPEDVATQKVKEGLRYKSSKYADLYQAHILHFKGTVKSINAMPLWTRNKETGKVGKTKFKKCTLAYKTDQIFKELRKQEDIVQFKSYKHKVNMYIGFTVDEIARVKDNPKSYAENRTPLVDMLWTKEHCIDYVSEELGFIPKSSVCNICYANDFQRVYEVYKNDKKGWERLLYLDDVMENKPKDHSIKDDVFMFKWQASNNLRLKNVDMEELAKEAKKADKQISIFDEESENACIGGCFL